VPDELRATAQKIVEHTRHTAGIKWGLYGLSGNRGHLQEEASLSELLGREERVYLLPPEETDNGAGHRLIEVFARLAAGVCLLAETPTNIRRKSTKKAQHRWRFSKLPLTTEYVLAPDVRIGFDCTEAVRAYVSGDRRGLPRMQWIVRGHWRNQPCGPNHSERKRIWIQPHWKGPEDAPRLFREHKIMPDRDPE
jgi:hypothetical protein